MDAVLLIEIRAPGHARKKEGDEGHTQLARELRVDLREAARVVRAVVRRDHHARQDNGGSRAAAARHDLAKVLFGLFERQAPETVVGAELDEHDIGLLGQQPVETPESPAEVSPLTPALIARIFMPS